MPSLIPNQPSDAVSREAFLAQGFRSLASLVVSHLPDFDGLSQALKPPIATIELTQCTAYQGSGCHICYDACPLPEKAIDLLEGLPMVLIEKCTGCGDCLPACPTPGALVTRQLKPL